MIFINFNIGMFENGGYQRPFYFPAGEIVSVKDSSLAVSSFSGQVIGISLGGEFDPIL